MANDQLNQARAAIDARRAERRNATPEMRSFMALETIADELALIRALLQQSQGIPDEKQPPAHPEAFLAG